MKSAKHKLIPISVLIIGQNCQKTLNRCLNSLIRFEEVIFIDGGSKDTTEEIASSYSNVIYHLNPWPGFTKQRNFSVKQSSKDWCLMLDSDECCSKQLVSYIEKIDFENTKTLLFRIVRTEYLEKIKIEIGFGKSDFQERLFKKKHITYCDGVHHKHLIDGILSNPTHPDTENLPRHLRIEHNPDYMLEQAIEKLPSYSILIAEQKMQKGRTSSPIIIIFSFIGTFFQIYLKSFRAGKIGFVAAVMEALHRCIVKLHIYTVLHIRNSKKNNSNKF